MNLEYKHLLPTEFPGNSRVWVYQSNRLFTLSESLEVESLLNNFCTEWRSHGDKVNAFANLFFGQFIVLMTDESGVAVSGCSTDGSVKFIKQLGSRFGVDFFNRTNLAFIVKDKVELLPLGQLQYALDNNFINADTLYFNNTILTKKELEESWIIPVKNSWLGKKMGVAVNT